MQGLYAAAGLESPVPSPAKQPVGAVVVNAHQTPDGEIDVQPRATDSAGEHQASEDEDIAPDVTPRLKEDMPAGDQAGKDAPHGKAGNQVHGSGGSSRSPLLDRHVLCQPAPF